MTEKMIGERNSGIDTPSYEKAGRWGEQGIRSTVKVENENNVLCYLMGRTEPNAPAGRGGVKLKRFSALWRCISRRHKTLTKPGPEILPPA